MNENLKGSIEVNVKVYKINTMEQRYIYNQRLVDWIQSQSNQRMARLQIRDILGITAQTLWNYEKNKRVMPFMAYSLLQTKLGINGNDSDAKR